MTSPDRILFQTRQPLLSLSMAKLQEEAFRGTRKELSASVTWTEQHRDGSNHGLIESVVASFQKVPSESALWGCSSALEKLQ